MARTLKDSMVEIERRIASSEQRLGAVGSSRRVDGERKRSVVVSRSIIDDDFDLGAWFAVSVQTSGGVA